MTQSVASIIDSRRVTGFQIRVLALCGFVMFLDGFDTQIIAYMAPMISKEWHLTKADMGPVFSYGLAGLMAGFLILSPLSDRIGRRRVVIFSTFLFGVFTLLTASAHSVGQLGMFRFLTGLGLGGATPGAVALTAEYSPTRLRATWVLTIYCGFSLGFIAAGIASAQLLGVYGWRSLLWVGALIPLVTAVLLLLWLPESIESLTRTKDGLSRIKLTLSRMFPDAPADELQLGAIDAVRAPSPLVVLLGGGRLFGTVMIWIAFFMNLGMFYFLQSWLPTILTDAGHTGGTVATITALTTVGGILAILVVGPLMDRANPYLTVAALFLLGAVFVAVFGATLNASLPVVMTIAFLAGCCVSGGQKSGIALSALFYPLSMRSTGVGWCLGISRVGGILGPLVVGWMLQRHVAPAEIFYWGAVPMLCAGVAVLAMGFVYRGR